MSNVCVQCGLSPVDRHTWYLVAGGRYGWAQYAVKNKKCAVLALKNPNTRESPNKYHHGFGDIGSRYWGTQSVLSKESGTRLVRGAGRERLVLAATQGSQLVGLHR